MDFHLSFLAGRLENYAMYGCFYKKFIHTGNFIKSLKVYPDNIKLKLKRDCFIQFHENGNCYLIDTVSTPVDEVIVTQMVTMKGIRLFNWKKMQPKSLLVKVEHFIKHPDYALLMASKIIDPLVAGKVYAGRKVIGNVVRQSDIQDFKEQGAVIKMGAIASRDLEPLIKARR